MFIVTERDLLEHGVPEILKQVSEACRRKHEHYAENFEMSSFLAWAEVIDENILRMWVSVAEKMAGCQK